MTDPTLVLAPGDAELLTATKSGDTAAYGQLYERHQAAARSLARQLVRGPAEADDVVAEAFARVLDLLRRGGGPADGFRPYLLTAVRRVSYDWYRGERRQVATGEIEKLDPGQPLIDPVVEGLERSLAARAFLSLPQRWQAVLWHTEIEGAKPAEVAPLLGLTANGVAALSYRAREGLRQAYLQMHLSVVARRECRPVLAKLGASVRGGLSRRDTESVLLHLEGCEDCRAVYAELTDVNATLRGMVAPIFLGPAAVAYLAAAKASAGWLLRPVRWFRHAPTQVQAVTAGGLAAAVALAVVAGVLLTGQNSPAPRHRHTAAGPLPAASQPQTPGGAPPGAHHQASLPHAHPRAAQLPSSRTAAAPQAAAPSAAQQQPAPAAAAPPPAPPAAPPPAAPPPAAPAPPAPPPPAPAPPPAAPPGPAPSPAQLQITAQASASVVCANAGVTITAPGGGSPGLGSLGVGASVLTGPASCPGVSAAASAQVRP
jgi:RNA polymerase sigma factor (sigma-70 family)